MKLTELGSALRVLLCPLLRMYGNSTLDVHVHSVTVLCTNGGSSFLGSKRLPQPVPVVYSFHREFLYTLGGISWALGKDWCGCVPLLQTAVYGASFHPCEIMKPLVYAALSLTFSRGCAPPASSAPLPTVYFSFA